VAENRSVRKRNFVPFFKPRFHDYFFISFLGQISTSSYTREKNIGMIENSLDLTERRGRPQLEICVWLRIFLKDYIWEKCA